jgi:arylsulfatase A-like enzyme
VREPVAHIAQGELQGEASLLGLAEDEIDALHQVVHMGDQLLLEDQVALVDVRHVPAMDAKDPIVVAMGGSEPHVEIFEQRVVELHLMGVVAGLRLEQGCQTATQEAPDGTAAGSHRRRVPGAVHGGKVRAGRRNLGFGRRLLLGRLGWSHGTRRRNSGRRREQSALPDVVADAPHLGRDALPFVGHPRIVTVPFAAGIIADCMRPAPALVLGLAALLGASCSRGPRRPNVVLLSLDTVRADHLGCYGYERDTSPRLDAFARGATLYRRAFASASWTLPTHASLFTGRYAFEHGAHGLRSKDPARSLAALAPEQTTLAEALRERGYATAGFVANTGFLSPRCGMNQGFETYQLKRLPARDLNAAALDFVRRPRKGPFFLFVNYMEAHRPYDARPRPGLLERAPSQATDLVPRLYEAVLPGRADAPADLVRELIDQYDTAIANLDEEVGRLLDGLHAAGRDADTVVVITSDHGEFFGEHRLAEHSKDVYQEVLAVPLLVRAPGQSQGRVVATLASSVDVPRLILEHFETPDAWRELFPLALGNHPVLAEIYYARPKDLWNPVWGPRFDRIRTALFDWPLKLIDSSDGRHELFDLSRDPREATNLLATQPAEAQRLRAELARFRASRPHAPSPEAEPAIEPEIEELRALGYVGG